jgi:hypothetical protein
MITNHVKVEGRVWSDFRSGNPPLVTEGFVNLVW